MNTLDKFKLDGRVVIITGGAGLLGQEYSRAIVEAGGVPIVADINPKRSDMYVDVTNKLSVKKLVKEVIKKFGKIDGLINNVALDPKFDKKNSNKHSTSFEDYSLDIWNKSLSVDLTGMFLCTQAVAPVMLKQRSGSIVNISSTYGLAGPDQRIYPQNSFKPVTYSVTKSAVLGMTRYLAAYWMDKGIRVNTLTPGGVYNNHDNEFVKQYSARTTLGRMANKDEYNAAILFLLSDASSYMTGSNLVIDGGWTAW
jgi:NAD(P)-dependent dehydrogenase (short-subunit alcohol dehydrogenase family)